jgi:predicted PurR-regulated permease PerM
MAKVRLPARTQAWTSWDILRATLIVLGVWIFLQLLWVAREVVFVGFLGALFGITAARGVDSLQERLRVPRGLGATVLVLGTFGLVVGLAWATAPQIGEQLGELRTQVPQAIEQVQRWVQQRVGGVTDLLQQDGGGQGGGQPLQGEGAQGEAGGPARDGARQGETGRPAGGAAPIDIRQGLAQQMAGVGRAFFTVFSSTLSALGGLIVIIFVTIFIAADPELYHRGLMHLFPRSSRERAGEVLTALAATLRRWLATQLVGMLIIGVVTTTALLILDVKAAFALGLIAGLLEFVPYIGPILSAVPAVAMALLDSPEKALWVVLAYTAIQQLEGVVIQPLLMQKGLELPPVLTVLGQTAMALVFGFLGLLVAVPLLGTIMTAVKMLYVRDVVGDEVSVPGVEEEYA